jgi:hypothetical protein
MRGNQLFQYDAAAQQVTTFGAQRFASIALGESVPEGTLVYDVYAVANRAYPRCAGRILRKAAVEYVAIGHFVGDLVIVPPDAPRPAYVTASNIEEVGGVASNLTVLFFDASPKGLQGGGDWAAVFAQVSAGIYQYQAVINNATVLHYYEIPSQMALPNIHGPNGLAGGLPIMAPHVAHPQETLGGGYVTLATKLYAAPPTPSANGVLEDPNRPYTLRCFKGGAEIWRTPPRVLPVICSVSSDRWLYCTGFEGFRARATYGFANPRLQMPGNVFDPNITENVHGIWSGLPYWAIRHDGTQNAPLGSPKTNVAGAKYMDNWPGTEINPVIGGFRTTHIFAPYLVGSTGYFLPPGGGGFPGGGRLIALGQIDRGHHDCLKNSELVGGALPADANEWLSVAGS